MKLLLELCLFLAGTYGSSIAYPQEIEPQFGCSETDIDGACHIKELTIDSTDSHDGSSFPEVSVLYLDKCKFDIFSPQIADKVHNTTESLFILDGHVPKVYLKPTLKFFTDLRAETVEILIDPFDNIQLELFDVEGLLRAIPKNVRHLKSLVTLDLCENEIEQCDLNQLKGLERLRKVNLGHNRIGSVTTTGKVNLPNLEELFLHDNQMEALDLTDLKADRLKRLYLSQNHLVRIDGFPERYKQLQRVDLYQNKWDCEWLEGTLDALRDAEVEILSFLPGKVCDERGSVKVTVIECQRITS
ncbi:uncharacterized protein LOC134211867 [Armigeres subalbatus]|uniref:uncharacterized protein LOC134211867 n=1 Tax=Armigeres subalbatus TaxID=124917 RepID=UPI002ED195D2